MWQTCYDHMSRMHKCAGTKLNQPTCTPQQQDETKKEEDEEEEEGDEELECSS